MKGFAETYECLLLHRVHIFTRGETGLVCLPTHLYTSTLLVMINVMKGIGRAVHPPTLTSLG
jgi:hypothetical protein